MNKNLFFKEIKRNAFSLIMWMIVISILIFFTMSFYRTFIKNQQQIIGMMGIMPSGILKFRGITNLSDLFSILGFYAANNTIYMMLLGSVYAIVLSANILLKEEYHKTAEFLLSKPITRGEVFITKWAILTMNIILLNLVADLVGLISIEVFKTGSYSIKSYLLLSFDTLLLNFLFGSIGLFISTLIKRPKPITTFSIGIVLILYFLFNISRITPSAEKFGYLSPFKYIDTNVLAPGYGIDIWHMFYFISGALVLTVLSYQIYRRKDIFT
jgi:ABC-2 type transport system permease protein